jgi:GTP-binding protein EngB required for normal cell division
MQRVSVRLSKLEELADLAADAGAPDVVEEARALAERIAAGRFYVTCFGQFKRGKSTLLNALVDDPILPTGVVPVTAVVTILRYGRRRSARVRFADGEWRTIDPRALSAYVSEEENPGNEKEVAAVEVLVPSTLLASGMCLVDTPGIGSVSTANTAVTRAFVPHVDAALVVVGADPPISGDEMTLVEEVAREVSDLIFVLNKADRLSDEERDEAARFAQRILAERLRRPVGRIHQVSATERLASAASERDFPALVDALETLAHRSGSDLVRAAEERGLRLLAGRLLRDLEEDRGALVRPLEESERRITGLRRCAAEAERSMNDLRYLLQAEQDRLSRAFGERRKEFLDHALAEARREHQRSLAGEWDRCERSRRAFRRRSQELAREIATRWLDRWLAAEQPLAEAMYRQTGDRFVELANGFLRRLAASGEPSLASLPRAVSPELGFRTKSRLYYTELMRLTSPPPLSWLKNLVSRRAAFLRSTEREAGAYLERLLSTNSARIQGDLEERVLESRRRLESEIRSSLTEVYASAERALERARERRAAGGEAVEQELCRIDALRDRVAGLQPYPAAVGGGAR